MTTLDFRHCKTVEDVEAVFNKKKKELDIVKNVLEEGEISSNRKGP